MTSTSDQIQIWSPEFRKLLQEESMQQILKKVKEAKKIGLKKHMTQKQKEAFSKQITNNLNSLQQSTITPVQQQKSSTKIRTITPAQQRKSSSIIRTRTSASANQKIPASLSQIMDPELLKVNFSDIIHNKFKPKRSKTDIIHKQQNEPKYVLKIPTQEQQNEPKYGLKIPTQEQLKSDFRTEVKKKIIKDIRDIIIYKLEPIFEKRYPNKETRSQKIIEFLTTNPPFKKVFKQIIPKIISLEEKETTQKPKLLNKILDDLERLPNLPGSRDSTDLSDEKLREIILDMVQTNYQQKMTPPVKKNWYKFLKAYYKKHKKDVPLLKVLWAYLHPGYNI